jgi:formyl-CoA transferase
MVLPYTKQQFDAVFDAGGRHDLLGDDRYSTGRNRVLNAPFLYEQVGLMLAERTTDEWLVTFKECDVPAASVARLDDMVDALPEAEHPHTGTYKVIPPAVRFSASPQKVRRPAPLIGEHTEEVLAEAGYDADRIAGLLGAGAFPKVPEEFAET